MCESGCSHDLHQIRRHQTQRIKNNGDPGNFVPEIQACHLESEVHKLVMLLMNFANYIAVKRGRIRNYINKLISFIKKRQDPVYVNNKNCPLLPVVIRVVHLKSVCG